MIIAIDFDGTIVEHQFPRIGKPLPNAFDVMKRWKKKGHKLILWTCRYEDTDPTYEDQYVLTMATHFCNFQGITFDAVNCNVEGIGFNPRPKIYADIYIDDRSLFAPHPLDWLQIERLVAEWHNS